MSRPAARLTALPLAWVLLALLAGAFLRFHQLGQVPPGLHYDFAANAILANDIAFGNFRDVFITAYTGKEVLFFYTAGLLFRTVGSSIFTLQLTAAVYGVLGIAACAFAARQVTWGWRRSRWLAAAAAGLLAFSFMHLVWSRYGERATTEPFVQGLAVGFLFRGLRQGREAGGRMTPGALISLALAGAFTGLAAYTYLAARLFPIPMAAALLIDLWQARPRRPLLAGYAAFLAAAGLVFAPPGVFFLRNPGAFLVRASQLTPRAGETDLLWRGVTGALGMIVFAGEPYDRFNIPGRPIFDPLSGLFFGLGLAVIVIYLLRARTRLPAAFLLVYTLTFLAPTALSVHDIFPSNVRSMGLLPLLMVFPAAGLTVALDWLAARARLDFARLAAPAVALGLAAGCLSTYVAYFDQWAVAPDLHYANDTDLVEASRWLNGQDTGGASLYFSAIHYRHPTAAYLARDFANIRWFTGGQSLAIPPGPTIYVFPHSAPPPEDWLAGWTPLAAPLGPDGTPDFRAYRFDSAPPLPDFQPASGNFGNLIAITGFRSPAPGVADFRLKVLNPPDQPDYRLVADLADAAGFHWAQAFNDSYFSEQWQPGETVLVRLTFSPPAGTPPGSYRLLTTLYSASAKTNVPAITADGGSAAYAPAGPLTIAAGAPQALAAPLVTLDGLNLVGLEAPPAHALPGAAVPFTARWQIPAKLTAGVTLTVKLNDRVLESGAPVGGAYPATDWQPGELVVDRHAPRLPRDLPPGAYNLTLNDFLIGTVTVDALDRQFSAPQPAVTSGARFGDLFELAGYDRAPGQVTLYWRCLKETPVDYTAFVHVLGPDGALIGQRDSQPRAGAYPTSLWAAGEYVSDTISLPADGALEVGWYLPETGERLGAAVRLP